MNSLQIRCWSELGNILVQNLFRKLRALPWCRHWCLGVGEAYQEFSALRRRWSSFRQIFLWLNRQCGEIGRMMKLPCGQVSVWSNFLWSNFLWSNFFRSNILRSNRQHRRKNRGYLIQQQLFELVTTNIQWKQDLKIILNQMFVVQHRFNLSTFFQQLIHEDVEVLKRRL